MIFIKMKNIVKKLIGPDSVDFSFTQQAIRIITLTGGMPRLNSSYNTVEVKTPFATMRLILLRSAGRVKISTPQINERGGVR
jgi:hypothetical protein